MNKLELARKEISAIDAEMAALFERRIHACRLVAEYKKENGLPVRDPARESRMLDAYRNFLTDETLTEYYLQFVKNTIDVSCRYQEALLNREDTQ